jgi:hypothetical protein
MPYQDLDDLGMSEERRQRQGREVIVSLNVWIRAVFEQHTDHLHAAVICRAHQRRHSMLVARVDVCSRQHGRKLIYLAALDNAPQIAR